MIFFFNHVYVPVHQFIETLKDSEGGFFEIEYDEREGYERVVKRALDSLDDVGKRLERCVIFFGKKS